MPPDPNQGKCKYCNHLKISGSNNYLCTYPRTGDARWDYVKDAEWEDEVCCYRVNTDGACPLWEVIPE